MAKYQMQEMNLPSENGEHVLYPRLVLNGQLEMQYIIDRVADNTTYNVAEIRGVLEAFTKEMAYQLGQGYSVKVDNLGLFTASLELKKDKQREEVSEDATHRNAQSIQVGSVKFRPDKKFVKLTDKNCNLERSQHKFARSSQKYTAEERLELVRKYLNTNPFITVNEYAALTGLCRTPAAKEIKALSQQPDSGIDSTGRGTHRVYIRKAQN